MSWHHLIVYTRPHRIGAATFTKSSHPQLVFARLLKKYLGRKRGTSELNRIPDDQATLRYGKKIAAAPNIIGR